MFKSDQLVPCFSQSRLTSLTTLVVYVVYTRTFSFCSLGGWFRFIIVYVVVVRLLSSLLYYCGCDLGFFPLPCVGCTRSISTSVYYYYPPISKCACDVVGAARLSVSPTVCLFVLLSLRESLYLIGKSGNASISNYDLLLLFCAAN